MLPPESRRLAIACTAAGRGSSRSAAITVAGGPVPVMPHAPTTPSSTSAAIVGRHASAYVVQLVARRCCWSPSPGSTRPSSTMFVWRKQRSTRSRRNVSRLRSSERRMQSGAGSSTGSPSMTLVETRTPAGRRPPNASATTRSDSPRPYAGARSSRSTPAAIAAWRVATASSRSVGPQTCPRPPPPRLSAPTGPRAPSVRVSITTVVRCSGCGGRGSSGPTSP